MRAVLNISLPEKMALKIRKEVGTGKYATVSEFFRDLLRNWEETKTLTGLEQSRREIKTGKGKILHSLKNLR